MKEPPVAIGFLIGWLCIEHKKRIQNTEGSNVTYRKIGGQSAGPGQKSVVCHTLGAPGPPEWGKGCQREDHWLVVGAGVLNASTT